MRGRLDRRSASEFRCNLGPDVIVRASTASQNVPLSLENRACADHHFLLTWNAMNRPTAEAFRLSKYTPEKPA